MKLPIHESAIFRHADDVWREGRHGQDGNGTDQGCLQRFWLRREAQTRTAQGITFEMKSRAPAHAGALFFPRRGGGQDTVCLAPFGLEMKYFSRMINF